MYEAVIPEIRIIDTTLRDGEQSAGVALGEKEKTEVARIIDSMGVYQIEAGIPAMGGAEKRSIQRIALMGLKSRISAWNRLNVGDIDASMECGEVVVHISVPSSDLQIKRKLNKDRTWVLDMTRRCVERAREKDFEVSLGLEDASRADPAYLREICVLAASMGVKLVRYADTVGHLHRSKIFKELGPLKDGLPLDLEIHAHNDLGMAVSNSMAAVQAGAVYVDTTVGGIGERTGNCHFLNFVRAARCCLDAFKDWDLQKLAFSEQLVLKKMRLRHM